MNFIRKTFLWFILGIFLALWGYTQFTKKSPCEIPIKYAIGAFDTRFNISKKDFLTAMEQASYIWENSIGINLFQYNISDKSEGYFDFLQKYFQRQNVLVSLIYDDRQRISNQNKILISEIDETKQSAEAIKSHFLSIKEQYSQAQSQYFSLLNQLKSVQIEYNSEVGYWNKRGGASRDEYDKLAKEKVNIMILNTTLETKRIEVNNLADEINTLIKKYNFLVTSANSTINTINRTAGQEFEEGLYISDGREERINIYEFGNKDILVRVLAHEFGHVLGLEHNDNPDSIMHYLNKSENMKPTREDIQALKAVCSKK